MKIKLSSKQDTPQKINSVVAFNVAIEACVSYVNFF